MNIRETNAKIGRPSRIKEDMEMKQMEILKLKKHNKQNVCAFAFKFYKRGQQQDRRREEVEETPNLKMQ